MDRITQLFQPKRSTQDKLADWGMATNQAFAAQGQGSRSYGDALNEIKANRLAEQSQLFDLFSKSKYLEMAEEDREWKKVEFAAEQGERRSQAMWDVLNPILEGASQQSRINMIRTAMELSNQAEQAGTLDDYKAREIALKASEGFRAAPKSGGSGYSHVKSVDGGLFNLATNEWVVPRKEGAAGFGYEGTGMNQQESNVLLFGDPNSAAYSLAYHRQYNAMGGHMPPNIKPPPDWEPPPEKPTQMGVEQGKVAGYVHRMETAEETMKSLESEGYNPENAWDWAMRKIPGAGNYAITNEGQRYYQAAADWVRAKLRRESGAVIGKEEMADEISTYFPVPGDSEETIQQKAKARQTAVESMQFGTGQIPEQVPAPSATDPLDPLGILE